MTFDPFRDVRDAVPTEPSSAVERQRAAPWAGVVFAVAVVMVIIAGWYFLGSTMSPSMRADNPSPAERSQTR
jgi:hypothetical protein